MSRIVRRCYNCRFGSKEKEKVKLPDGKFFSKHYCTVNEQDVWSPTPRQCSDHLFANEHAS